MARIITNGEWLLKKKNKTNMTTNREKALIWWNNLEVIKQMQFCHKYFSTPQNLRLHKTLTGSEIEQIWIKEQQQHT